MRLSEPRVPPLTDDELDDETREYLQHLPPEARALNVFRTFARHPMLVKRRRELGRYILLESTLPARERELLILRTGWLCRAEYEWGQHVIRARAAGVTDEEIAWVREGPDAAGWDEGDAALLRATDELNDDAFISERTWQELSKRWDTQQLIDIIFTVGEYHVVSMALNTLGVQLDEGVKGFEQ